jgi:hypothetical protein
MRYLFLIYTDPSRMEEPDPADIAAHVAFAKEAIRDGAYITCDALTSTTSATTVRVREGAVLTTDGPFAETKEVLGGFYMLECADLDEAIARAAKIPPAAHGSIEIRPIAEIPGWDEAIGLAPAAAVGGR